MKRCSYCKKNRRKFSFWKNISAKDGLQQVCIKCRKQFYKTKFKGKEKQYKDWYKSRQKQVDAFVYSKKDKPCMDCGIKYPHYVMDFDHVRGEKYMGISIMRTRRMSLEKLTEEIEKCDVVCANCHRIRTNKRNPSRFLK